MAEPTPAELNESAMNLFSRGHGFEAARQLQWALIGNPEYAEAWHNRAMVLRALNDPFDATLCCERAIQLNPDCAAYYNTMGVCWASMTQYGKAIGYYRNALALDQGLQAGWHNMGSALNLAGDYVESTNCYRNAVKLDPKNPTYHLGLAASLLRRGIYTEGFEEYEWRFKDNDAFHRGHPLPLLADIEDCEGLVLYAEQGFGDTIMMLRFATMMRRMYDFPVYVEVKKNLADLARTIEGIDGVVVYGEKTPEECTHSLPIMSAIRFCEIPTADYLPDCVPYFDVPPRPQGLPKRTWDDGKLNVGICWRTGVRPYQAELFEYADRKSVEPHFMNPLGQIANVRWVSLQVPRSILSFPMEEPELVDFMDTAQVIKDLDLVVSVDTAVAHLAGALAVPTLLMTPFDNCWRWMGAKLSSSWYPSMTHYRQPAPGDWPSVISLVKANIENQAVAKKAAAA